ncbi:MAG: formyltetrahydrofolate deformylase [Candidatus Omnitrophica bacterium]|nr:formyltetrahydrofolate deformylase [Candidatus Omnitrophota bacterium]
MSKAILLISCPDRKGLVAKVSNFLYTNNGNIENADQHIDAQTNTFFMRIEWALKGFKIPKEKISGEFAKIAHVFDMRFSIHYSSDVPRMAVFTSRFTHCLYDLLLRYREGQFNCVVPLIVSNHPDAKSIAKSFDIPFFQLPVAKKTKKSIERKELALLKKEKIDCIALARYTQIFSESFVKVFENRMINIHHSFLPAFIGSNPYKQAYLRGVKIIGASSHYVTKELDAGPIIEQDTVRISHRDSVADLRRKGEDLEKIVLSRAVRLHLSRKVLVYNNKTVVFE